MSRLLRLGIACLGLLVVGCKREGARIPAAGIPAAAGMRFTETAADAGIHFRLSHRGKSPLTILETANGGCGFLDYDGDGRSDVLLVGQPFPALFRNVGGGSFRDVTQSAGLRVSGRWMGCAAADYDNDGDTDVLLTGYRCAALLRNEGARFRDVTRMAGIATGLWTTSAAFADVDRDGLLDLYLGAYLKYHVGQRDLCRLGPVQSACGPEMYEPERGRFYRQVQGGRFVDRTRTYGLDAGAGKTWGVAFADYNGDLWPDLYVANDMEPCHLYENRSGRAFRDVGLAMGVAYDARGDVQGAMGVDWGDYDDDGAPDLFVSTYFQQAKALFRNEGPGRPFRDLSHAAGIARPALAMVGFGGGFADLDNDGDLDLFMASGHVRDNIHAFDAGQTYAQRPLLFRNDGNGRFTDVSLTAGPAFSERWVGRGAAFGDYDGDGDLDILVLDLEGPVRLLRNDSPARAWLEIALRGRRSNRDGLGAGVTTWMGGRRQFREATRGGSVLSTRDSAVHFGLGTSAGPVNVEVRWPSGRRMLRSLPVGRRIVVSEAITP